ncbi:MAG: phenylalanine--tRNA ligase beta subunit-related protein, partial [Candidatus Marsarchaeota archaeon]|nr:phenylalanine--tRNA ligase beta subunit-related protein [Candidatus Marsarchaeota archaeon]
MTKVEFMLSDFRALGLAQEELESAIPGIGMEVEELSGKSIKIDVTPNRPELLNFDMMANALLMFTGKRKPDAEKYKAEDAQSPKVVVDESVTGIRPYISCMIARGLDLSGNRLRYLIDFSEKLSEGYGRHRSKLAMGIHNLDAINGNIEYLAGDGKFIPLGSSEARSFTDILRDSQKGVAYSHTVSKGNGKVPYLRDSEKILSMIPIINSEASKISHNTKNLFIDMTGTSSTAVSDAADIMACALIAGGA